MIRDVPPLEYLDRQHRLAHLNAQIAEGDHLNAPMWIAAMRDLLAEVPPVPFLEGHQYRVRLLGGAPSVKHRHWESPDGQAGSIDVPVIEAPEWRDILATYRGVAPAGTPWVGLHLLETEHDGYMAIANVDVMQAEELA